MALNKNEYLNKVLETHRMSHIEPLVIKYKSRRDEVKEAIETFYKDKIYNPINSGSFAKHTAVNIKFDFDIVVPFKRNSFSSLKEMFDDLYNFLNEEFKNKGTITQQKVSIGIEFSQDQDGDVIKLDIVAGRELSTDSYKDDNKLNLYINPKLDYNEEKAYVQTNIQAQIDNIKSKDNERKILRLLKVWKINHNENYKSFLLELFTIRAFQDKEINGGLWEMLSSTMQYIQEKSKLEGFSLIDPGNSNNNIMETLEPMEKLNLSNSMKNILERINDNEDNLKYYFIVNKDFDKQDETLSYGITGNTVQPSKPTNNQRFG